MLNRILIVLVTLLWAQAAAATPAEVKALKVTILSTSLVDRVGTGEAVGEWGFAALVEADGRAILYDTGEKTDTVLKNAKALGIDLSRVEDVVISHHHGDHTGGLVALRRELMKTNPRALSRAHVGRGALLPRPLKGKEWNWLLKEKAAYEALGGTFVIHENPAEILPGVWFTGPVPRAASKGYFAPGRKLLTPAGEQVDTVPEYGVLVANTAAGLVLLTGCGHSGIINAAEYAKRFVREAPLEAVIGGLHLSRVSDEEARSVAENLARLGLRHFLGGHCTGIEPTLQIRRAAGLSRRTAAYGAVGATYVLGSGIDPQPIAR